MKNFIIALLLLVCLKASSQSTGRNFEMQGKIDQNDGTIYMVYDDSARTIMDSSRILNGTFQFSGNITQPLIAYLNLTKTLRVDIRTVYVFLEPSEITVQLKSKPLRMVKVEGSKTHSDLVEWKTADTKLKESFSVALNRLETETDSNKLKMLQDSLVLYNDQKRKTEYNFIKAHPQSYVSPYLLDTHYLNYTIDQLKDIYKKMGGELQSSLFGKELLTHINTMTFNSKGTLAADIVTKDFITNKPFNLKLLRGRYIMMDFWGSWCAPCIKLMPSIAEEHKKYGGKDVEFVSVCFDYNGNMAKCTDMANKIGMRWTNI